MLLCDFLLAPLGLLLLFPRFNLSRRRHYALWYSAVLILPIIMVVWCYPAWYNGPSLFIAMMSMLIGIPLLLLGAWVCSHIAKRYLAGT
jgi:cytochrome b subunit of formate dehydrogenase